MLSILMIRSVLAAALLSERYAKAEAIVSELDRYFSPFLPCEKESAYEIDKMLAAMKTDAERQKLIDKYDYHLKLYCYGIERFREIPELSAYLKDYLWSYDERLKELDLVFQEAFSL